MHEQTLIICCQFAYGTTVSQLREEIHQNDNGDDNGGLMVKMVSLHWCLVMVKVVRGNDGRVLMVVSVVVASVVMCDQT